MPTPGFPAGTLSEDGFPIWVMDLSDEHTVGTVHVVRGLDPGDALLALGASPAGITRCTLPAGRPGQAVSSLPRAAIGPVSATAVLLAGQVGGWTFVYDDLGLTAFGDDAETRGGKAPPARMLSRDGREAATSTFTICGDTLLSYAADGGRLLEASGNVDPAEDDIPAGLRTAIRLAGNFGSGDNDDLDDGINMRVLCALAGLSITLDELRKIPLLAAPLG
jgi:hypothetical protein